MNVPLPRRLPFLVVAVTVALLAVAGLFLGAAGHALAHPLGNFTINRYARVEVYKDTLRLHYILDYAEIPTFQLQTEIDTNLDDQMSQAELDAYALKSRTTFPAKFDLSVNGQKLAVTPVAQTIQQLPGQGGIPIVRVVYVYDAPVTAQGNVTVTFSDRNFADKAGWKELIVQPSAGANIAVDPAFTVDRSDALRKYPAETLSSAPDQRDVSFAWQTGTGGAAPEQAGAQAASTGRSSSGLASLIDNDGSLGIILVSLLVAFVLGAQHAIGPGHGKAMVGAYLVGSRGKPKHAVFLGMTVTVAHTSSVWLLTFVTLVAAEFIAPDTLFFYLGLSSGALVVIIGAALLFARVRGALPRESTDGAHRHGRFGRAHSHGPAEPVQAVVQHDQEHELAHEHGHDHVHQDPLMEATEGRITWRSLLALGVSGGLLPCPSAIIVMLAAISFGKILFGMALVVAFSLGLAFVLSAIGIALVLGRTASKRGTLSGLFKRPVFARIVTVMPILSAVGVMIAGLYITYQAWNTPL